MIIRKQHKIKIYDKSGKYIKTITRTSIQSINCGYTTIYQYSINGKKYWCVEGILQLPKSEIKKVRK